MILNNFLFLKLFLTILCKVDSLPDVRIAVFPQALVVEAVNLGRSGENLPAAGIQWRTSGGPGMDGCQTCVICLDSWLPLRMVIRSLNLTWGGQSGEGEGEVKGGKGECDCEGGEG